MPITLGVTEHIRVALVAMSLVGVTSSEGAVPHPVVGVLGRCAVDEVVKAIVQRVAVEMPNVLHVLRPIAHERKHHQMMDERLNPPTAIVLMQGYAVGPVAVGAAAGSVLLDCICALRQAF